nr:MAG TPA: hypothetical protein [Bacteriophage sp.]
MSQRAYKNEAFTSLYVWLTPGFTLRLTLKCLLYMLFD